MRLFILIILLAALILPGAALAAPVAQTPQTAIVTTDTLNVRAGPDATSARVGQAKRGDALAVVDRNADATWLWVRLPNGQEGWVSAALVRLNNKPAAPSVPASKTGVPAGAVQVQFVDVVDGDTIKVSWGGVTEALRYIGMDTPERGQPGYDAATNANRALLTPVLYVVSDRSDRDPYDRLLRYVYSDAGVMVNAELVRQGWAQPLEFPPDTAHAAEFRALAVEAARARRGFWGETASGDTMPYAQTLRSANVRKGPGASFAVTTTLPAGTPLTIFGRTSTGDWLQVRAPDRKGGWMSASLVKLNVDPTAIPVPDDVPLTDQPAPVAKAPAAAVPVPVPAAPEPNPNASVVISYVFYDGVVRQVESDEYAEIINRGSSPVNLQGWRLNAGDAGQDFYFPGYELQPGQACRVYTNEGHPESGGFSFGSGKAIWNNKGECGYLFDASGAQVSQSCY